MSIQAYRYLIPVVAVFVVIFFETMKRIVGTWSTYQGSHGPIILAISIYMIWTRREEIKRLDIRPAIFSGASLTIAGCFLLVSGRFSSILLLQYLSLVVTMIGLVWLLWGSSYLKVLWYPILYIIFMFPIFSEILSGISIYLQTAAASIAFIILKLFGITAFRSGTFIELPSVTLEVAKECNGVNHIMALVSLAVPLAYWSQDSQLKKLTLISSAFIIGVVANGMRVAVIGLWAVYSGNGNVHGPYDLFYVSFIFFFGMFALVTLSSIMGKIGKKDRAVEIKINHLSAVPPERQGYLFSAMSAVVILSITAVYLFLLKPKPVYLTRPLSEFPYTIGNWQGRDAKFSAPPFSYFLADNELRRVYRDAAGHEVVVYIGYFPKQVQDSEVVHYRFDPLQSGAETFSISVSSNAANIRRQETTEAGVRRVNYFWYDINGRIVTDRYTAKMATIIDSILHRRTNAAIVVISTVNSEQASLDFVKEILSVTQRHIRSQEM